MTIVNTTDMLRIRTPFFVLGRAPTRFVHNSVTSANTMVSLVTVC